MIDFFPVVEGEASLGYGTDFRMHAGGSILNVAVALSRLEQPSAFVCKVADDYFGRYLRTYMQVEGVNTKFLLASPGTHSTLAFVAMENGHPAYSFYSEGSADTLLTANEIDEALYRETKILHLGSISLLNGTTPEAILKTAQRLKDKALISFDPNIRPNLIHNEAVYRDMLARIFSLADVVKCSDADLTWLYPGRSSEECLAALLALGPALVVVTQGERGAIAASVGGAQGRVAAFSVPVVDTVGAGDAFCAGLLTCLSEPELRTRDELERISGEVIDGMLRFAAGVSALNCTRAGANAPRRTEVEDFLRRE
ncbi:fructokinase [Ktedonospora formicarum]|uniref:Fructokinase n=1 Tax=Ktedonospora formicarum TaxID=2778364 RepID=A0A8J3MRQ1_9CHLR|nr:fructokinase [Ktedonospora formicarum]